MNAAATGRISWFDDPNVSLRLSLPQFLEVRVEVVKLIWEDVGFGDEIELLAAEALLHLHVVVAEAVLPSNLMTLWEVIDPLELVEAFV